MAPGPGAVAPDGLALVSGLTAATVQEGQDNDWAGAGGISYAVAGGSGPAFAQGPAFSTGGRGLALPQGPASGSDELQGPDGSPGEPVSPAAITAGEIPLDVLLSDPGLSAQGGSTGIQQVVELIPVEDSSLALVATLYSLPSAPRSEPSDGGDASGDGGESVPSSASPPPWAAFVIGLDGAIERSGAACAKALSEGARAEAGAATDAPGEPPEWRRPILPTPEGTPQPQRAEGSSQIASQAAVHGAPSSREADPNPDDAGERQPLIQGVVAAVWAASGGALMAGWPWARRRFRGGRGRGPNGPGRGESDRVEEGRQPIA